MPRAYSYLRFSTPEQQRGDSFRRQSARAKDYAEKYNLDLDESLDFHDPGVSAFRGKNLESGGLGEFLTAVQRGLVERGSYLLVESLDRISRQSPRKAVQTLGAICDEGITVVTLLDNREYTSENLDADPFSLLISLLYFIRANEESETKSKRLKDVWEEKRSKALDRPLTTIAPAWLILDKSNHAFKVIEDRAAVVQRIFNEYPQGSGPDGIAKGLNREGLETWGEGKRKGRLWHRSYVVKILENPSVTGTYIPHLLTHDGKKRKREPLDPVGGYYPAVIDQTTFSRVQELRKAKGGTMRGRKTSYPLRNVFSGLAVCSRCGSSVIRISKGKLQYLGCSSAKAGRGCKYTSIPLQKFEDRFSRDLILSLRKIPTEHEEYRSLQSLIQYREVQLGAARSELSNIMAAMKAGHANLSSSIEDISIFLNQEVGTVPKTVVEEITRLEHSLEKYEKDLSVLRSQEKAKVPAALEMKLDDLASAVQKFPWNVQRVNAALRALCSKIVIDGPDDAIILHFRHVAEPLILENVFG